MSTTTLTTGYRNGIQLLRQALECSPQILAAELDVDPATTAQWKRVAHHYLDPSDSPRKQQRVLTELQRRNHSLERLLMIDHYAHKATTRGTAWHIREQLCTMHGTYTDVKNHAKQLANHHTTPTPPRTGINATTPTNGVRTLTIRDDERTISNLLLGLDNLADANPNLKTTPQSKARLHAFKTALATRIRRAEASNNATPHNSTAQPSNTSGHAGTDDDTASPAHPPATPHIDDNGSEFDLPIPRLRTMVIIGLADYIRVLSGHGDDVTLALTDGTTMTGAQYLNTLIHHRTNDATSCEHEHCHYKACNNTSDDSSSCSTEHCHCVANNNDVTYALFHPTDGGINTYIARFANAKQRDLAVAEHPVCAWPGCHVPGYLCEMHHLTAHKHGGETKPSNLAPLCRYHNGVNNDDPYRRSTRGRMDRIDGRVTHTSPGGRHSVNAHPASQHGATHIINRDRFGTAHSTPPDTGSPDTRPPDTGPPPSG